MYFTVRTIINQCLIVTELAHSALPIHQCRCSMFSQKPKLGIQPKVWTGLMLSTNTQSHSAVHWMPCLSPCLKTFCLEWRHAIYWHKDMTTYAYVLLSAGLGQNLVWKQSKMGLRVAFASLTLHRNTQLKNTDWKKLLTKGVNSSEFCAYGQSLSADTYC